MAATTALNVIALIEELEPTAQGLVVELINLWHGNTADVKTILQGEVTDLQLIIDKARAAQGLPKDPAPIADQDPTPPSAR